MLLSRVLYQIEATPIREILELYIVRFVVT